MRAGSFSVSATTGADIGACADAARRHLPTTGLVWSAWVQVYFQNERYGRSLFFWGVSLFIRGGTTESRNKGGCVIEIEEDKEHER